MHVETRIVVCVRAFVFCISSGKVFFTCWDLVEENKWCIFLCSCMIFMLLWNESFPLYISLVLVWSQTIIWKCVFNSLEMIVQNIKTQLICLLRLSTASCFLWEIVCLLVYQHIKHLQDVLNKQFSSVLVNYCLCVLLKTAYMLDSACELQSEREHVHQGGFLLWKHPTIPCSLVGNRLIIMRKHIRGVNR